MDLVASDVILADNVAHQHGNTGWSYIRSTPATIHLYKTILAMNYEQESRDQTRTNELLETGPRRDELQGSRNFVVKSAFEPLMDGIRVHILDPAIFRHFHYEWDLQTVDQHRSIVSGLV